MNEEEMKKQLEDQEVKVSLTKGEIFQLNMCVVARMGNAHIGFANAKDEKESNFYGNLLGYLTNLSQKLAEAIQDVKKG